MNVPPFQPHRFQNAASHYVAGRIPYSPRLIGRVAELVRLCPAHHVLDLGCGPGPLAKAFAPLVARVLGVDPEPEMLRVAARDSPPNIEWRQASSYDIAPDWGGFQLVTMGRSFHWMDRADTLRRLEALVPASGAVALFHDTHPELPENAWWKEYRELVRRYETEAGVHRRAGWVPHETVLMESAFSQLEVHAVIESRRTSIASIVARAMSKSSIAMASASGSVVSLGAEIETLLAPYAQDGHVTEIVATEAMLGFRAG
jgi:2-polyprenyl-3-methyl-5-hydroxy-6-metoxy-1,4-benzoquinol methylase